MPDSPKIYLEPYWSGDLKQLCIWHKEHLKLNFPTQKFHKKLFLEDLKNKTGNKFMIRTLNKENIGFVWWDIKKNKYEGRVETNLRYIHIDSKYRGKGYGKYILKMIDNFSKRIVLGTYIDNKSARAFYEKIGYKPYRIIYRKEL